MLVFGGKDEKQIDGNIIRDIINDKGGGNLRAVVEEKRGRGRPPKGSGKGGIKTVSTELDENQQKALDELYRPENWAAVASIPFNLRKAMTGSKVFELDAEEKALLGSPLSMMIRSLGILDPKYIAMTVFFSNLTAIWTEKEILYRAQLKKEVE